jgi:hypothetical protein
MRSLVRSSLVTPWRDLLRALIWASGRITGAVVAHIVAHRKAKAAEELYRHLSRLSDAELAARGLDRRQLPQLMVERLG